MVRKAMNYSQEIDDKKMGYKKGNGKEECCQGKWMFGTGEYWTRGHNSNDSSFCFLENSLGLRNLFNTDLYHLHGSNLGIHLTAIMDSTTGL